MLAGNADQGKRPCDVSLFSVAPPRRDSCADASPARADLAVTLSLAGRTARPGRAAGAGPGRRLRRRQGARRLSAARTHRCADRCHASLCGRNGRQRGAGAARCGRSPARLEASALDQGRGRLLDRSRRRPRRGRGARRRAAPCLPGARPQGAGAVHGCAAASLSGAQRRSGRCRRSLFRMRAYITARGPFSEADDRELLPRIASRSWSPRTAAAMRATARSQPPARSASTVDLLRRPALPAVPHGIGPSMTRSAWIDHGAAPPPSAGVDERRTAGPRDHLRLRRADDDECRHVGSDWSAAASVVTCTLSSARPIARPNTSGVDGGRCWRRRRKRGAELPGSRARDRIVERDHEARARRRIEPPLDHIPGLEIVRERQRAEIMAERRARRVPPPPAWR